MYQALKWLKLKNVLWIKIMYDKTLNFGFNQDLNQLKDTVYKFAQNEISPLAKEVDENNEFPNFLWEKFGELLECF